LNTKIFPKIFVIAFENMQIFAWIRIRNGNQSGSGIFIGEKIWIRIRKKRIGTDSKHYLLA